MILHDFYIVKRIFFFCNEMAQEICTVVRGKKDFSALCKGECLCHFAHGFVLSVASNATTPGVHLCKKKNNNQVTLLEKQVQSQLHLRTVLGGGEMLCFKRQCRQILQLHEISLLIFIHW